jgi:pimeloyl-ACP methyl ester carboxylesterase
MKRRIGRCASLMAILLAALAPRLATAQQEIPPPSGMGRVVLIISGKSGRGPYTPIATRIAALGYHVVLYDSLPFVGTQGRALSAAIEQALKSPHALPGKVGLVGFSLGGGMVLKYGSAWSDRVAIVAAWYPNTGRYLRPGLSEDAIDAPALAERIKVPVVMFAGTDDYYLFCCVIDKARAIASAARAQNAPFELTTYSGTASICLALTIVRPPPRTLLRARRPR